MLRRKRKKPKVFPPRRLWVVKVPRKVKKKKKKRLSGQGLGKILYKIDANVSFYNLTKNTND